MIKSLAPKSLSNTTTLKQLPNNVVVTKDGKLITLKNGSGLILTTNGFVQL